MVTMVDLHGYAEFSKYAETIDPKGPPVVFYFSGEKLPSGESWCPDCVEGTYKLIPTYLQNWSLSLISIVYK